MATCPICFEDIKVKASPDSCDHLFCLSCLEKWSKLGSFCPVDRKRYKKIVNLESDSIVQVKSRKRKKSRTVYDFSAKCEVCCDENKPEVLLLCDCCDLAYHTHCLSPPLETIPAGLWFCPTCISVEKRLKEKNGITKEVEVDLCNSNRLFQKGRRHGQRTRGKFAEISPTLPSCSSISDESIKERNKLQRRRKISSVHTSYFQSQIKIEAAESYEDSCYSTSLKPVKIIIKKEDQDICESRITKFHSVSHIKTETNEKSQGDGLSFVNRSNLQYLTIRDDGSFYLDFPELENQKNIDSALTKSSRSNYDHCAGNSAEMHNLVKSNFSCNSFYRNQESDWTINNLTHYDTNRTESFRTKKDVIDTNTGQNFRFDEEVFCKKEPESAAIDDENSSNSTKEEKALSRSDLKHLIVRNDGTFFLDCPTFVEAKPDIKALQNTACASSFGKLSHYQESKQNVSKHLNIRSDGTFVWEDPSPVDIKPDLEALQNTPSASTDDKSTQDQELKRNVIKHLNIRSDGTFFLDAPTTLDIKPDGNASCDTPSTPSSDKSSNHQELRHNDLEHCVLKSDETFFKDSSASTDTKPDLEALRNNPDTSSGYESLTSLSGSEHFMDEKDETDYSSVDIKPDIKTLQTTSDTSSENESLGHQHLRHLTIRSDGTLFLDIPD